MRLGFYQFYDAAVAGVQIKEDDPLMKYSPAHMRHCIDLLRQSLMCHADTTIEVKEGPVVQKGLEQRTSVETGTSSFPGLRAGSSKIPLRQRIFSVLSHAIFVTDGRNENYGHGALAR
jgi:hypothetical protein